MGTKIITRFMPSVIIGFLISVYQSILHCTSFEALLIIFYGNSLLVIKLLDYALDSKMPKS